MAVLLMTSCAFLAWLLLHLRSVRVPDGLTEPTKYRLLMASRVFPRLFETLYVIYHRRNPFASIQAKRLITENMEPAPQESVKGSNIRSRVTHFDEVRVRVYEPIEAKEGLQPGLIFMHGGGMANGSIDSYDGLTRTMAEKLDMFVASIDYRLAPEHPFPTGYNDNYRATVWFLNNAHKFGVDAQRVALTGDSGGGTFAAGLSQVIHDDPTIPSPKLQVLIYPGLQQLDFRSHSYQKYEADFGNDGALTRDRIGDFICMYLHGIADPAAIRRSVYNEHVSQVLVDTLPVMKYVNRELIPEEMRLSEKHTQQWQEMSTCCGKDAVWNELERFYLDTRFAPLTRGDLSGLPKAMITTCEFDNLRDDGYFYARRLSEAGVSVLYKNYEGAFHGILWATKNVQFEVGKQMLTDIISFIRENI